VDLRKLYVRDKKWGRTSQIRKTHKGLAPQNGIRKLPLLWKVDPQSSKYHQCEHFFTSSFFQTVGPI
jgi:hypothetical protein